MAALLLGTTHTQSGFPGLNASGKTTGFAHFIHVNNHVAGQHQADLFFRRTVHFSSYEFYFERCASFASFDRINLDENRVLLQ